MGSNLIAALAVPQPLRLGAGSELSGSGPIGGPFNLTAQGIALTNIGPAALTWSCGVTSVWLNAAPNGGTLPSGAATSIALTLTPQASALAAGQYVAELWITNLTDGFVQNRQFTLQLWPSLIVNGGFETGDFAGWTWFGNTSSTFVGGPPYAYTGKYGALLGPGGSLGYLSQTPATVPGQAYLLSLWLYSPDGKGPNQFQVSWNGQMLFNQVNLGILGWTNLAYLVTATNTNSVVQIGFMDNPSYLGLDDVSLVTVNQPVLQAPIPDGANLLLSWAAQLGFQYQIQSRTNLAQGSWSVAATVTNAQDIASFAVPVGTNSQQFFRLLVLP
jgi:hypothetical protein